MYVYLNDQGAVVELIPDEHPAFPGIPIERRYAPSFVQKLLHVPDGTAVLQNWVYDPETGDFAPPPEPEEDPPGPQEPPLSQRVETLEQETAALTEAIRRGMAL